MCMVFPRALRASCASRRCIGHATRGHDGGHFLSGRAWPRPAGQLLADPTRWLLSTGGASMIGAHLHQRVHVGGQ